MRLIVLSLSPSIEYVQCLMEAGASGVLTKECASQELVAAVEKVRSGGVYLSPALVDRFVHRYTRSGPLGPSQRGLAPREREVLRLIAAGHSTKEIAATLAVSSKTVETHRRRMMEKLNRHSVAELTTYAVAQGLVSLEPMM
jgi:DNA-binding NarL/FixJ family response regulator